MARRDTGKVSLNEGLSERSEAGGSVMVHAGSCSQPRHRYVSWLHRENEFAVLWKFQDVSLDRG